MGQYLFVLRYLALGDSYTVGEGITQAESFPYQLVARLRANGAVFEDPVVIAQTGWTTGELMEGIRQRNAIGSFDLITLLIGVNNQYRGLPLEQYRKNCWSYSRMRSTPSI